jgi:hypothetical protein
MFRNKVLTFAVASGLAAIPALAAPRPDTPTRDRLQTLAFHADQTENDASHMNVYMSDQFDWMAQGLQLTNLKDDVNRLGRDVQQIQAENNLSPAEQRVVGRIAKRLNLLANDTNDTILFGAAHRDLLWQPGYEHTITLLYSNAQQLKQEVHQAIQLENSSERG